MRGRGYLAAGILAVLAVAGCSHDSAGKSSAGGAPAANAGGAVPAPQAAGGGSADSATGRALSAAGAQQGSSPQGSSAEPLVGGGYKIVNAQLTVAVKGARNVALKADTAENIALAAGGEVDSDDRTSGSDATATLQLRVPPDSVPDTLDRLSQLGIEKSRHSSTTDVTQKVVDVQSRVGSARRSINRLRLLFDKATKVSQIIALEDELSTREADLEALQAQARALSRQTSLATITLSLITAPKKHVAPPVKHTHKRGGFVGALERGWHGFTAAAVWIAEAIGTVLPFLVLLIVVALAARVLWPRLPRRHRPTPAATE